MIHIFQNPNFGENWFTFPGLYTHLVNQSSDGDSIVEVGSWKGKSSAFMAVTIANSRKKINFTCVDTWLGSVEHQECEEVKNDTLYELFIENMSPVKDYFTPLRLASVEASSKFEDNSLQAVFIDASHEYEEVKQDIKHWLPKVKHGGILCGHDYHPSWQGVVDAVHETLGSSNIDISFHRENCWLYRKT
jgi:hypothetical protein